MSSVLLNVWSHPTYWHHPSIPGPPSSFPLLNKTHPPHHSRLHIDPPELTYEVMKCRHRFLLILESSSLDLADAQQDFLHSLNDCMLDDARKAKLKEEVAAIMDRGLPNIGH